MTHIVNRILTQNSWCFSGFSTTFFHLQFYSNCEQKSRGNLVFCSGLDSECEQNSDFNSAHIVVQFPGAADFSSCVLKLYTYKDLIFLSVEM